MNAKSWIAGLAFVALLATTAAPASGQQSGPPRDPTGDYLLRMGGFLDSHPDLRYRLLGMERYKSGQHEEALRFFRRASRYGDKLSQAMVAEMLWEGHGDAQNRALGYAWMDVAAERGYRLLTAKREQYWAALDESERTRALTAGRDILEEYGDTAALPRIATVLRRASKQVTGSRTGASATGRSMEIWIPGPGSRVNPNAVHVISAASFYEPDFWDPDKYQAWHDGMWEWSESRPGRVIVGTPEEAMQPEPQDGDH